MAFNYSFNKFLIKNCYSFVRKTHSESALVRDVAGNVKKKIEKAPFMKNLFAGIVDQDVLVFPEIESVEKNVPLIDRTQVHLESKAVVGEEKEFVRLLKSGICRLGYPEIDGGVECQSTDLLQEVEQIDVSPMTSLLVETQYSIIIRNILNYGSEEQKVKYLSDLICGKIFGAFAVFEEEVGIDPSSFHSLAITSSGSEVSFTLNGTKNWVTNANKANFFIVLANVKDCNRLSVPGTLSAFLIERGTQGVSINKTNTLTSECDICQMKFDNVSLGPQNLLGHIGDGYDIMAENLESNKFIFNGTVIKLLRKLSSHVAVTLSELKCDTSPACEHELIQYRITKLMTTIYALESSIYHLAGMQDLYKMDTSLESVIVQHLIHSYGLQAINDCVNMLGVRSFDHNKPYYSLLKDFPLYLRFFTSPVVPNLYISLKGMQFASMVVGDVIKKSRNPLNYPTFALKRMINFQRNFMDKPKMNRNLYMQYHPSLKPSALHLEYSINRLQFGLESILVQFGTESVERQVHLLRLSEIASDIFSMVAVLSRASRSYCTGIRFCDQELLAANIWCLQTVEKIKKNVSEITAKEPVVSEHTFYSITPDVFSNKGYFFTNPLTKNIL